MAKSINILDKDYLRWVQDLCKRYRQSQIKAAVKVNRELLRYYWELGKDIEEKQADNKYGSKFYATLSRDLRHEMPDVEGLSETSIRYAKRFYVLYKQQVVILPQPVEESEKANLPQTVERLDKEKVPQPAGQLEKENLPQAVAQISDIAPQLGEQTSATATAQQVAEQLQQEIFSIPWGHHRYIIDKCPNDSGKALFFVHRAVEDKLSENLNENSNGIEEI